MNSGAAQGMQRSEEWPKSVRSQSRVWRKGSTRDDGSARGLVLQKNQTTKAPRKSGDWDTIFGRASSLWLRVLVVKIAFAEFVVKSPHQ